MRHSPVRIYTGAGDGTQPAPTILPQDVIAPFSLGSDRPASWLSRIFAWLLLMLALLAFCVIRLIAGDPFRDDAGY